MNDLKSLKQLFENKIFRIPDYQRGYSWTEMQLKELWNDIISMLPGKDHYTGMISLKKITQEDMDKDPKKWNEERWIFDSWGYEGFEIVDGQQRLTTLIILINEIINYYYANKNEKEEEDLNIDGLPLSEIKKEFIVISKDRSSIIKTFRFGYECDNPSDKYFKHSILGEPNGGTISETYYTLNLLNAKKFFKERIEKLVETGSIHDLEEMYKKITQKLKFNIYYIENDFNVYVAFETMNNRGKKLSYLELLKNRLIYLSTLFKAKDEKEKVRDNINDTWKEIYGYLGRNKNHPLPDDEFLQNHWMIYFGYQTRRILDDIDNKKWKTIPYNFFLLNVYFLQQNIENQNLNLIKTVSYDAEEEEWDNKIDEEYEEDEIDIQKNDNLDNKYSLTLEKINDYVNSLKELIQYWYSMHFPNDIENKEIKTYLERLDKIGFVNSKPLITVLLSKKNISDEDKIKILKEIERFNFLHYRFNNYRSNYNNSVFYNLARDLYANKIGVNDIENEIKKIDYLSDNNVMTYKSIGNEIDRIFKKDGYYYKKETLKYILYCYESRLREGKGSVRLYPQEIFKTDEKDQVSVEHIYPQTPTNEYWIKMFKNYNENEKKRLKGSLGNLLPLSKSINSSLQNDSFEEKKIGKHRIDEDGNARGYCNGSYNELEVVEKYKEWNAEAILDRGLKILDFMEEEWDFFFASKADKIKVLGLDFMIKEEDYDTDVVEPINEEIRRNEIYKDIEEPLFLKVNNIVYAIGYFVNNGILIKAGSRIRSDVVSDRAYMRKKVEKDREKANIENDIFTKDTFYDTPSRAANVILSLNKNGWTNWKNSKGITLQDLVGRKDS